MVREVCENGIGGVEISVICDGIERSEKEDRCYSSECCITHIN